MRNRFFTLPSALPILVLVVPAAAQEEKWDDLIQAIVDKTGLSAEKAAAAAKSAVDFLKDMLPAEIASQIDGVLSGGPWWD